MEEPPKGAETGDCVISAGFWPKPNGDEGAFAPKFAKDDEAGLLSDFTPVFAPKLKGDDDDWLGCPNGDDVWEPPKENPPDGVRLLRGA